MSKPLRESIEALVDDRYEWLVQTVAKDRKMETYKVKTLIVDHDGDGMPDQPATDVPEDDVAVVGGTRLLQNSPNPFSGGTAIEYVVPHESRVSLRIYNVAGRLVRTLVRDETAGGPGQVIWDGRDEGGRALSSGVYFYRLEDGEQALTRKSVLLRR